MTCRRSPRLGAWISTRASSSRPSSCSGPPLVLPTVVAGVAAGIEAWARAHHLRWIEDESNLDLSYDRNYLRRQILPVEDRGGLAETGAGVVVAALPEGAAPALDLRPRQRRARGGERGAGGADATSLSGEAKGLRRLRGATLALLAAGDGVYNLAVTPDGRTLVATNKRGRSVSVFDAASGKELARVPTQRRVVHGVGLRVVRLAQLFDAPLHRAQLALDLEQRRVDREPHVGALVLAEGLEQQALGVHGDDRVQHADKIR